MNPSNLKIKQAAHCVTQLIQVGEQSRASYGEQETT